MLPYKTVKLVSREEHRTIFYQPGYYRGLKDEKSDENQISIKMDSYEKIYEFNTEFYSSYPPEIIEDAFINYLTLNNL